ncbi:MAG: hypothetical protein LBI04_06655 [Treponema sp.]|jgi:hypothetical protein|nr:hypothetical protein [Treponema sp.]
MAIKIQAFLAAILLAVLVTPSVFAQAEDSETAAAPAVSEDGESPEQQNFYIDRSGDEPHFIQRLFWEESRYVLYYEVTVERWGERERSYSEVQRIITEDAFVEVSLIAGHYRYQVALYDLLEDLSFTTGWREFDIIRALQPELSGFSPSAFYLDEDSLWELSLRGENLLPESEIRLIQSREHSAGSTTIRPKQHAAAGRSAHLTFSETSLTPGEYFVYVKNPGGLETLLGTFLITYKKPLDINISLGYTPIVPLYGYLFKDFKSQGGSNIEPFPAGIYPLSGGAKISFVPFRRIWGNMGMELSGSFAYLKNEEENYTAQGFLLNTHFNFLLQKFLYKRTFLFNASIGAGFVTLFNFHFTYPIGDPTETKTTLIPSAAGGLSLTMFVRKPFYISAGLDFIQAFSVESPMPGFITPFIMAGIQF